MSFVIVEISEKDLDSLKEFTDSAIGKGYYSKQELKEIFLKSQAEDQNQQTRVCSFILKNSQNEILGMRLTYPPGNWKKGKGSGANKGLNQQLWPHSIEHTAYFQSLFLAPEVQGQGWGVKLSEKSIDVLRQVGAKGIVCHSWKESPNNSSSRYLEKMGFKVMAEHPLYWKDVDYNCTRCGTPPCQCTALEMYLRLDNK